MTEKAISDIVDEHERIDFFIAIIDALSKQIPKSVIVKDIEYRIGSGRTYERGICFCPVCKQCIKNETNYCGNCGQKLRWGN